MEGIALQFEVFADIHLHLKIQIKDKHMPLTLTFQYLRVKWHELTCYVSQEHLTPKEGLNAGCYSNVSCNYSVIAGVNYNQLNHSQRCATRLALHNVTQHDWVFIQNESCFQVVAQIRCDQRSKIKTYCGTSV